MLKNKKILLGVTASIAAYKSANLVRILKKKGAQVRVIQTPSSLQFVTPLTLSTLSENPVYSEMIDDEKNWNNHVEIGNWADLMLIAPTSAKTLSKMCSGDCDNLLLATYLSATCPVYFAPAMDLDMYKHSSTELNIKRLVSNKNILIPASVGELASGLVGEGRMEEPKNIVEFIEKDLLKKSPFHKRKILITAGPTIEKIDKVRYISNFSSGKMGVSLAKVGAEMGADILLIKGPTKVEIDHYNIKTIDVESADEMLKEVLKNKDKFDIGIFSAAVSDFKPKNVILGKLKKSNVLDKIDLELNKDILAEYSKYKKKDQFTVGFALEADNEIENAKTKLKQKRLDMIVLNSLNDDKATFGYDTNKITIIDSNNNIEKYELKSKYNVAKDIYNKILKEL